MRGLDTEVYLNNLEKRRAECKVQSRDELNEAIRTMLPKIIWDNQKIFVHKAILYKKAKEYAKVHGLDSLVSLGKWVEKVGTLNILQVFKALSVKKSSRRYTS
jgi:hypothetical protein